MPAQRMQQNIGLNNFRGRPDSFSAEQGNSLVSPAHWDRNALAKVQHVNPMSSRPYSDATQGGNAARSLYQEQIPQSIVDRENEANKEVVSQTYEQDMEIGYEDTPKPTPLTLEGLEIKFQDEILKLSKEHNDAEDAEITRHKKVIVEINNKYQEKLSALRARQAIQREKVLHKESEARLHQYQTAGTGQSPTRMGTSEPHGYAGPTISHTHQGHAPAQFNYLGEGHQYPGRDTNQGTSGRIPYLGGRVYKNADR
ncbi:hypothetical protein ACH5RR_019077 [Cinchona calisaya]|uniref:Uncharacterized protein n=1 Tax=Cinchona calisaya TaxID=153742 RepID=A0ABD2ZPK9_9GENT